MSSRTEKAATIKPKSKPRSTSTKQRAGNTKSAQPTATVDEQSLAGVVGEMPTIVAVSGETPVVTVHYADITIDPRLQNRAQVHREGYIKEIVAAIRDGVPLLPVTLFEDPADGTKRLVDGHARVEAHKQAGAGDVRATIREGGFREAFQFALGVNTEHGVRRTNKDLRKAVEAALRDPEMARWASGLIAEKCRCTDRYVDGVKKEVAGSNGSNLPEKVLGRDGKWQSAKHSVHGPTTKQSKARTAAHVEPADSAGDHLHDATVAAMDDPTDEAGLPESGQNEATTTVVTEPMQLQPDGEAPPITQSVEETSAEEAIEEELRALVSHLDHPAALIEQFMERLGNADATTVRRLVTNPNKLAHARAFANNLIALLDRLDCESAVDAPNDGSTEVAS